MNNKLKRKAFTLIELLVVIIIIALLASIVAPNFFGKLDNAKIKTAKAQLELISTALDMFRLDTGRYPTNNEGLEILWADESSIENFNGKYLPKPLKQDPWGHNYYYSTDNKEGQDYTLLSLGADGKNRGNDDGKDISIWE